MTAERGMLRIQAQTICLATPPPHRREAAGHPNPGNGAGNSMSSADRNARNDGADKHHGACSFSAEATDRPELRGSYPHRLLGVIGPMSQTVQRGQDKLQSPEPAIHPTGADLPEDPDNDHHDPESQDTPQHRRFLIQVRNVLIRLQVEKPDMLHRFKDQSDHGGDRQVFRRAEKGGREGANPSETAEGYDYQRRRSIPSTDG